MSEEKNKALVRRLIEAWNTRNWTVFDEVMAPNCIDHYALLGQKPGREGYREEQINVTNAFPDIQFTIKDMIAEGDKVAVHLTFTGTHKREFIGIPPTNKRVTVPEVTIWRIANGKLVEEWGFSDRLGIVGQLGVVPPIGVGKQQSIGH